MLLRPDTLPGTVMKTHKNSKMVKVFYEPPPFGPRTALNRSPYGSGVNRASPLIQRMSTMPPGIVIPGVVALIMALSWLPLSTFVCVIL